MRTCTVGTRTCTVGTFTFTVGTFTFTAGTFTAGTLIAGVWTATAGIFGAVGATVFRRIFVLVSTPVDDWVGGWDPVPGSAGQKIPDGSVDDEQSDNEKLVQEGMEEAEHDQMIQGTKQEARRDQIE